MTEPSVDEMMLYLIKGKKKVLYLSLIASGLILGAIYILSLIVKKYLFSFESGNVLKILLVTYLILISYLLYRFKFGKKNQMPYYGGIYVAYYKCTKCESLCGGIFGKGPTQKKIIDEECIHKWNALSKDRFDEKYLKLTEEK